MAEGEGRSAEVDVFNANQESTCFEVFEGNRTRVLSMVYVGECPGSQYD